MLLLLLCHNIIMQGMEFQMAICASADKSRCVEVIVPENAFYTGGSYGRGWECERGYRAAGGRCDLVALPDNAHLDQSGHDWECDPPFRRRGNTCTAP